jgi:hypothetical protein
LFAHPLHKILKIQVFLVPTALWRYGVASLA